MKKLSSALTVGLCTLLAASVHADDATPLSSKWAPWIDAEWDPGTHRSIGQFDAFAPVMQDDKSLLFVNPRMRFDDQDSQEYNWGLGYRRMVDKDWIFGGYTYLDRNVSGFSNTFQEVTLGLEAISEDWKFRVNDYQPFGVRSYSGQNAQAILSGGNLEIQSNTERSMQGEDIEAGYRVPMHDASASNQLWVYAGGYRFDAPDMRTVEGPRLRFEYEIGDVTVADRNLRLRLSGEYEHDDVRGTQYFAGIRIGIPLDDSGSSENTSKLTPLERHMVDPVQRDVDIVTNTGNPKTEAAINTYNNEVVSGVTKVNASTSNIASAVTSAGTNSIVVFDGSNGTITLPSSTSINMVNGQTLLGGGSSLLLRGANSGVQTVYYAPGSAPTLTGNVSFTSSSLINLADSTVIKGLTVAISGVPSARGISSTGAVNFTLTDTSIALNTINAKGVYISGGGGTITNNTFFSTADFLIGTAIYSTSSSALTISDNTIQLTGANGPSQGNGIMLSDSAPNSRIIGNTFVLNGVSAIRLQDSPSSVISHNLISLDPDGTLNTSYGIAILRGSDGTAITNNVIRGGLANTNAIRLTNSGGLNASSNISISNNTIDGPGEAAAIKLSGTTNNLSGSGNTFNGPTLCSVSGSHTGAINFVGGGHCP